MKSYDETVADMLCFLKSRDVCLSSINSHRDCALFENSDKAHYLRSIVIPEDLENAA